jgi:hypothetical protein
MPFLDDLIGVHDITINGGAPLPRRSVLNVIGSGVAAVDNQLTGTTDLTLPTSGYGETITPAAMSASVNDYAPTGFATAAVIRVSASSAGLSITGLDAGAQPRPVLVNAGSQTVSLPHQSGSSSAANRFICPGAAAYSLLPGATVELVRDPTSDRWRIVS